jgi:protoporphyrinogen oxidase
MKQPVKHHVVIIGGGFTGLSAAYELTLSGLSVTIFERDSELGGLAGSFNVNGERVEKFYHHWFTNDRYITHLISELGESDNIAYRPSRTGMYYENNFYKLSTPFDVLRLTPLGLIDRIRLGLLPIRARMTKDWKRLEGLTAAEWLKQLGGERVFRIIWEPLLVGKFGQFAGEISAVWFWNKLVLRGGSRSIRGKEILAYYRGGFAALIERLLAEIERHGGRIVTSTPVTGLIVDNCKVKGVKTPDGEKEADIVIATPALPVIADLVKMHVSNEYEQDLRRIRYLANICVVLELYRSLSDIYWLNVNDSNFPFVAVIEHTNFEPTETYSGKHIVYLSKYLPETATLYQMSNVEVFDFSITHLKRIFPCFNHSWVHKYHVWRARYAQPIVERFYSKLLPSKETPLEGFYISTMAQIYPEDRGVNYAIREGRQIGQLVASKLNQIVQL